MPNTTINDRNITWNFGNNNTLTLAMQSGMPTVNQPDQGENNMVYQDGAILIDLYHYGDNICNNYTVSLSAQDWEGATATCTPYENNQEFNIQLSADAIPNNVNAVVLNVSQNGGPNPGPSAPVIVSIATNSFGQDNKTAIFTMGEDSRSITFTNAYNTENNPHFEFENTGDNSALKTALAAGLTFHAEGACMDGQDDNYIVYFGGTGESDWKKAFSCSNGNYSLSFNEEEHVPDQGLNIFIRSANQPGPGPSDNYYVEFENPSSVGENNDYILVTSHDQSLAGKTFRLTPSSGTIGCAGDEHGTHCGIQFSSDPFDNSPENDFYINISGEGFDLDTSEFMVFLRGPAGAQGISEVSMVGGKYQFMLKNSGIEPGTNAVSIAIEEPHSIEPGPEERIHPGDPVAPTTVTVKNNLGTPGINKSFYFSRIEINWTPVMIYPEGIDCENNNNDRANNTKCPEVFTAQDFTYNKEANVNTVEIDFGTLFIRKFINTIKVNGETYNIPIDYTNRQSWLGHYDHQMTGFTLEVPYSETGYVIEVDADELEGRYQQIGNFLWTNDERNKYRPDGTLDDAYIGHSNLEVLSVNCHISDNNTPDNPDDDIYGFFRVDLGEDAPEDCVFEYQPDDDINTTGSLVVPEGSTVTVRLKPQYGWQVTSFRLSGDDEIETDPGAVAQYTLGIRRGNAHVGANVTEVDDEVNATSDKIKSGSISLGGEEIEEGTAMLTVGDADLTDEQKNEFQKQAGNYNVSTFLDIDLDQVFYNGQGGYWQGQEMSELAHEATITLTLEEGVDGNSVILVHKKHDGTYEIIPTEYNAKTHTIAFKTSSFSDYAIASAKVANADTRDKIIAYLLLFISSTLAAAIFALYTKKQNAAVKSLKD